MKKVFIMGATSGIGLHLALIYIAKGYIVGVAGRRESALKALKQVSPNTVFYKCIDITKEDAVSQAQSLVDSMGGMDIYFHSSGIGYQNVNLLEQLELDTVSVNCFGFTKMIDWATLYFERQNYGQLVAISSIAGTKGLGPAPSYSASKSYQQKYLQAISQRQKILGNEVYVTDIRPGFVDTDLLKDAKYPMIMDVESVAFQIFESVEKKKRVKTIDFRYRLLVMLWRFIPDAIYERLPLNMSQK